jgi:hypothetical protein
MANSIADIEFIANGKREQGNEYVRVPYTR